jgi:hypothetical protein
MYNLNFHATFKYLQSLIVRDLLVIVYEACGDLAMNNNMVIIYLCAGHTKTK